MGIGERIAESRRRLGLSQTAFAERVGVSLSSQKRYEGGEREPDTSYIKSLRSLGVDVEYVLTGETSSDAQSDRVVHGLIELFRELGSRLGIPKSVVDAAWTQPLENPKIFDAGEKVDSSYVDAMLAHTSIEVDGPLLASILERIEDVQRKLKVELPASKKAKTAVMLYRAFRASKQVDLHLVEEAVTLAGD